MELSYGHDAPFDPELRLDSVLAYPELEAMMAQRYINRQLHPFLPYAIYNYSNAAQFDRKWNPTTLACRGLITRLHDVGASPHPGEHVVARPLRKFFNLSEHPDGTLPLTNSVVVTEKVDGSLGIGVANENGMFLATRGSFTSDQAVHATAVLRSKYADFVPNPAWTYLWEIVYPENRIVVKYGDLDDLILLGAVNTRTGRSVLLDEARKGWTGPTATVHPFRSLADALEAPARENVEGFVVHFVEADCRVKIKQDDYVALHRVLTNLSERSVWEVLAFHGNVASLLDVVPDEFYPWLHEVSERLTTAHARIIATVDNDVAAIIADLGALGITRDDTRFRKEFALRAKERKNAGWIFARLDGHAIETDVWDSLKPDVIKPTQTRIIDEDNN